MIDLRSDTVTKPSEEMLAAMLTAETGDDVYGEDPTVNALEALAADMTGKPAALFVTSGTQGNLLALLSHCERGDEYITGMTAHTYLHEAGGGAVLGSIQPQPLPLNVRGELELEEVIAAIKPDDYHYARTRLLCLENTQGGKVLSLDYMTQAVRMARDHGLRCHLDGARVFNAAVKLGEPVASITSLFDSVSLCLSKGLAAPVGSVLVGDTETIDKARRLRKMVGGGMRQAGILAAAGIYALNQHVERLADDHRRAAELARAVNQMHSIRLAEAPQTNMVMLDMTWESFVALRDFAQTKDIRLSTQRLVLHRDVSDNHLEHVIETFRTFDEALA